MNDLIKNQLKLLRIYHPLQRLYRGLITSSTNGLYRIKYAKYKGSGYLCNVCQASYSRFVPRFPSQKARNVITKNNVVAGFGHNVLCPNCMSGNRERLVIAVLKQKVNINQKQILHFSPEKNVFAYIKSKAFVTTADLTPGFYTTIDPRIMYADATQLQFDNEQFDIIIANHIMEHIPNDEKALKEIYRVLKVDGVAILQVPYSETLPNTVEQPLINDPLQQTRLFGQKDHVRIYNLNDYIRRLQKAGFSVERLSPEMLKEYRIHATQENETFLLCHKERVPELPVN